MNLEARGFILLLILAVVWTIGLINFVVEIYFTRAHDMRILVVDNRSVEVEFPKVFKRSWNTDIIVPPTTEFISEGRVYLPEADYIVYFLDRYYWASKELVLLDFADVEAVFLNPVISGLHFRFEDAGYVLANENSDLILRVLKSLYGRRSILRELSNIDFETNKIFLKRGITIQVFDWRVVEEKPEIIQNLINNAEDRSKYLLMSDGKILRVR